MVTNYKKYAAASDAAKTFALTVRGISGYFNGAVNSYLLFFDAKAVPANGTVPLRGFPIYPTAPFAQPWTEEFEVSNGLVWAVSTTLATLTISAETVDVFIEVDSAYDDTGTSTAGDYTTAIEVLQVWASANGPKKLKRIEITPITGSGNNSYLLLFADDAKTGKIIAVWELTTNTAHDFFFGDGLVPFSQANGILHNGCQLAISAVPTGLDAPGVDEFAIKATYK